jgi:two-component system sensor histidine kinase/response regulator
MSDKIGADHEAAVDAARLLLLRGMGPDDGWGMLPAVIEAFLADAPLQYAAIHAAAIGGGAVALEVAAHKLKGAASNLGADAVAAVCEDLETSARQGSAAGRLDLVRLQKALDRARHELVGALTESE